MKLVDSHVHFWNPQHINMPWLGGVAALNRVYLPADLATEAGDIEIEKIVFVEADVDPADALKEVAWVSSLTVDAPAIQGIVAFAPLEQGAKVDAYLQELAQYPLVKGVRRLIQSEALGFARQPDFVAGVQRLSYYGLSFDLCIYHPQMPDIIALVKQSPGVTFVLDHIGKPGIKAGLIDPWREHIKTLASFPNVWCKISGVATEADHTYWSRDALKLYINYAIAAFGIDRVMFGGDWPVSTLATNYQQWVEVLNWATDGLSETEKNKLFRENAMTFYSL